MSAVHREWKNGQAAAAAAPQPVGQIDAPGSFFMREARGDAKAADGTVYELNTHLSGAPLVRSSKTGKFFSLSWQDVLRLAIEAGIDRDGGVA